MTRGRLEAFSDGVIAIIITIMVLELVPPHGTSFTDLVPLWPKFLSYVMSFAYLAIYWNNHHHLLQAAKTVSGRVLWSNMLLLFWLSLVPFATSWMGENDFASQPVALYGVVLIMAAFSYYFLVRTLIHAPGQASTIREVMDNDRKGKASPLFYAIAIALSPFAPAASVALYILVAAIWIVPDPRIERRLGA
ncbi:MAG TPA: TMEM175 family protein [Candidatus Limnocylindrales bacterium]|nr:TMEM175 family protein [Candidatus Limnocylindrales bacterium]